mgnify:CR=1 FL=1
MPAGLFLLLVLFIATALALTFPQRTVGAEDRVAGLFKATLILLGTTLIAAPVLLAFFYPTALAPVISDL